MVIQACQKIHQLATLGRSVWVDVMSQSWAMSAKAVILTVLKKTIKQLMGKVCHISTECSPAPPTIKTHTGSNRHEGEKKQVDLFNRFKPHMIP